MVCFEASKIKASGDAGWGRLGRGIRHRVRYQHTDVDGLGFMSKELLEGVSPRSNLSELNESSFNASFLCRFVRWAAAHISKYPECPQSDSFEIYAISSTMPTLNSSSRNEWIVPVEETPAFQTEYDPIHRHLAFLIVF
jgi:hypothetical protein